MFALQSAARSEEVLLLYEAVLCVIKKWVGQGGKATLSTVPDADILREIVCLLTQQVRAGRATFLFKVKSRRGDPVNEGPDTLRSPQHPVQPFPPPVLPAPWSWLQPRPSSPAWPFSWWSWNYRLLTAGVAFCCCWRRSRRQRRTGFSTPTIPQLSWSKKHKRCSSMDSSFIVSPSFLAMS